MDKNTITGLFLIAAILIAFSIYNRPSQEQLEAQQRIQDSLTLVEQERNALNKINELEQRKADDSGSTVSAFFGVNATTADSLSTDSVRIDVATNNSRELVTLENDKLKLQINPLGGAIETVQLKNIKRFDGDSLMLLTGDNGRFNIELFNRQSVRIATENQWFRPILSDDGQSLTMRLESSPTQYVDFIYTLRSNDYMMDFDVHIAGMQNGLHPESMTNLHVNWEQKIRAQEKGRVFENRFSRIHYKYAKDDVRRLSETKNDREEVSEPTKWFSFKNQFFTSVIIADQPFNNVILDSKVLTDTAYVKDFKAEAWVPITMSPDKDLLTAGFQYYFGPVHYNTLKAYNETVAEGEKPLDLHEQVYLGYKWVSWVNKFFTIPVFNFFLKFGWSMGIIIFILTLLVKLIIAPLTYKSFMSSAKMRVLRPQIQEIEKKYPGQEQEMMLKRQQETMALYNKVGVSPMSGCLPILIQMPFLLALFFFFPSAIELRQQSFLWADDLSTFDSILSWGGNIPLVTRFLGNHISLFCLLMTVVNIIYTKYNMSLTDTGQTQMAGMKYMPIFMSVFMFFFLNNYPAGLNYYYFLSTLFTIVLTLVFKQVVDEKKLLAQLEANKNKPKKQSGFMARLQEAQKMQEKQMRERAKENAKRNMRR